MSNIECWANHHAAIKKLLILREKKAEKIRPGENDLHAGSRKNIGK